MKILPPEQNRLVEALNQMLADSALAEYSGATVTNIKPADGGHSSALLYTAELNNGHKLRVRVTQPDESGRHRPAYDVFKTTEEVFASGFNINRQIHAPVDIPETSYVVFAEPEIEGVYLQDNYEPTHAKATAKLVGKLHKMTAQESSAEREELRTLRVFRSMIETSGAMIDGVLAEIPIDNKEERVQALVNAFIGNRGVNDFKSVAISDTVTGERVEDIERKFMQVRELATLVAKEIVYNSMHERLLDRIDSSISVVENNSAGLPSSIIHVDPKPKNVLFHGSAERPQLIDWEYCGVGTPIYDAAYMINRNTDVKVHHDREEYLNRATAIINAYQEERLITNDEWKVMPTFLAMRTLHSAVEKYANFVSLLNPSCLPSDLSNPVRRLTSHEKEIAAVSAPTFMEELRARSNPLEFLNEFVSNIYLINLDRSCNRLSAFRKWSGHVGLNFRRIPAFDGVNRLKDEDVYHAHGNTPDGGSGIDTPDIKSKKAKVGCCLSHLEAINTAIKNLEKGDDRFIVIFEDDAYIDQKYAKFLQQVMPNIPQDAAMVCLGASPKFRKGHFFISSGAKGIAEVTGAYGLHCSLYSPKILPVIKDVFEANLKATREDGGILPVDMVTAKLQEYLSLSVVPDKPVYKRLIEVFRESCQRNGIDESELKVYATNPLVSGCYTPDDGNGLANSTIEGHQVDYTYKHFVGVNLRTLTRDQVKELVPFITEVKHKYYATGNRALFRDDMRSILIPFVRGEGEIKDYEELKKAISQKVSQLSLKSLEGEELLQKR